MIEFNKPTSEVVDKKKILRNLVSGYISTLPEERAANLLRDTTGLEKFFFKKSGKKESHRYSRGEDYSVYAEYKTTEYNQRRKTKTAPQEHFVLGLKKVVLGMVNSLPTQRAEEIIKNPGELLELVAGRALSLDELNGVVDTIGIPSINPESKKESKQAEETLSSIDEINRVTKRIWEDMDWKEADSQDFILSKVLKAFKKEGLHVKVEFFRPDDPEHGGDYIVVSNGRRGIVITKPGVKIDFPGIFSRPEKVPPDMIFFTDHITSFPEVVLDFEHKHGEQKTPSYWKLETLGKLAVVPKAAPEGV
jgi:hypothetical protein